MSPSRLHLELMSSICRLPAIRKLRSKVWKHQHLMHSQIEWGAMQVPTQLGTRAAEDIWLLACMCHIDMPPGCLPSMQQLAALSLWLFMCLALSLTL